MLIAALGFRAHSGWAAMVTATETDVLARSRLELVPAKNHEARQPYHSAREMSLGEARLFLDQCAADARKFAAASLRDAISALPALQTLLAGARILQGSGRPITDLAATLRSHAMIHTAEGQFFRNILHYACEACALTAEGVKEKEILSRAPLDLRITPGELQRRLAVLGKSLGPPWRQDEKLCTIAAWLAISPAHSA